MREIVIKKNDAGQRLDKFITKSLPSMPASLMYKAIRTKKIKVNRKRAEQNRILAEGDTLQLFIAEEFFTSGERDPSSLARIDPGVSVVYEDENIILVNKRPGVLVHDDKAGNENTLITHIRAYLYQKGEYDPVVEQSFAPALCNRIDRNTGGIVIAAKNAAALRILNEKIKNNEISKFYLCVVHGAPEKREGTLRGYLIKNSADNTVKVFDKKPKESGAKEIITKYRTLAERDGLALLEIELVTGRTHQIRAHMAHIGHPLLGDGKYGVNRADRADGYRHQALYAYKLRFDFKGEGGALDYLSGKQFELDKSEIPFANGF